MEILLTILQIDTKVPLWTVGSFALVYVIAGIWIVIKLWFSDKDNKEKIEHLFKKTEKMELKHSLELEKLRIENKSQLDSILVELKEYKNEIKELRDIVIKLNSAVEIYAMSSLKTRNKAA